MAMRSASTLLPRCSPTTMAAARRWLTDGRGKFLSEEEKAKENVYIQTMEREKMEKLKRKAEKGKEEAEKEEAEEKKTGTLVGGFKESQWCQNRRHHLLHD